MFFGAKRQSMFVLIIFTQFQHWWGSSSRSHLNVAYLIWHMRSFQILLPLTFSFCLLVFWRCFLLIILIDVIVSKWFIIRLRWRISDLAARSEFVKNNEFKKWKCCIFTSAVQIHSLLTVPSKSSVDLSVIVLVIIWSLIVMLLLSLKLLSFWGGCYVIDDKPANFQWVVM